MLKSLYEVFSNEQVNEKGRLLPPDYRPRDGYILQMGSIDYLAGMMDTFAISQFEELCGTDFTTIPINNEIVKDEEPAEVLEGQILIEN